MPVLTAHQLASNFPNVSMVPQPLADLTPSEAPGTTLTFYGNAFEVPWKGILSQRPDRYATSVAFASDRKIIVWHTNNSLGPLKAIADPKTSAYDLESALLNVTPAQIRFFDAPLLSANRAILLTGKAITASRDLKTGAYEFQTPAVRGFQIGNPAYAANTRLDFFDPTGNSLGEIVCFFGKNAAARGTQADLNRIIQTFHPIANSSTTAPVSASAALTPTK
jgi:hypothetical protein